MITLCEVGVRKLKILIKAKSEEAKNKLLDWVKNNKESTIYKDEPLTITEEVSKRKKRKINKNVARMLRIKTNKLIDDNNYISILENSFKIRVINTLNIEKEDFDLQVVLND